MQIQRLRYNDPVRIVLKILGVICAALALVFVGTMVWCQYANGQFDRVPNGQDIKLIGRWKGYPRMTFEADLGSSQRVAYYLLNSEGTGGFRSFEQEQPSFPGPEELREMQWGTSDGRIEILFNATDYRAHETFNYSVAPDGNFVQLSGNHQSMDFAPQWTKLGR